MSSEEERQFIREKLVPEILADFDRWGAEYQQDRDLGVRGEFANLYRKARKLKTLIWDGADGSAWREDTRTIVKEVVAHGLLLLLDLDRSPRREEVSGLSPVPPYQPEPHERKSCGVGCSPRLHELKGDCRYRLAEVDKP